MRALTRLGLVFVAALSAASCGDTGRTLFADVQWRLLCPGDIAGCQDGAPHDVYDFTGTHQGDGSLITAACAVTKTPGGDRLVNLSVSIGSRASLAVQNLVVSRDGGAPKGGTCGVTVIDDSVTYRGACGADVPTAAQPCRIADVRLNAPDRGDLEASVVCENLSAPADPVNLRRNVVGTHGSLASIHFMHCDGL